MIKNNSKSKKRTSKYPFPKKYYQGLSKKDKEEQIKELEKSRALYKKGVYIGRSQKSSFKSKKSTHIVEFEEKYNVNINDQKAVFKATGITPKAQKAIIKKGMGAFYSSGSRPNQSAQSWALARLASVILKHGAYKVDRHILIENNCDNIKPPKRQVGGKGKSITNPKGKSKSNPKGKSNTNPKGKSNPRSKIISCCKINDKNESEHLQCERKSDHKIFDLPRRFKRKSCKKIRGFTMESSCAPYKSCK